MIMVNLFGAPGAGKSTGAAYIFSRLKMAGVNCELVTEFAKDKVWEDNQEVLRNQVKILGEQYFRITRCENKVDVIVTDSPLINSCFYNNDQKLGVNFINLVLDLFNSYENLNFFINRTKPYVQAGRLQSEEESNKKGQNIKDSLQKLNIEFEQFDGDITDYDKIVNKILNITISRNLISPEIAALDPFKNSIVPEEKEKSPKEEIRETHFKEKIGDTEDNHELSQNTIYLYADGACSGNPGTGGYGVILVSKEREKEISGKKENTTNNRMELTAVIEGLKVIKKPSNIIIVSDSKYIVDTISLKRVHSWKENNWKLKNKKTVQNIDLWEQYLELAKKHNIVCRWVKGHTADNISSNKILKNKDIEYNKRCDKLAVEAIKKSE